MKKFKEYITEVLDKPLNYRWGKRTNDKWFGSFIIDEYAVLYKVTFTKHTYDPYTYGAEASPELMEILTGLDYDSSMRHEFWEVFFSASQIVTMRRTKKVKSEIYDIINFEKPVQFKVLATVVAMVDEFIRKEKPENIYFSSSEKSRSKVYYRLAQKIVKKHKYQADTIRSGFTGKDLFVLDRI